MLVVPTMTWVGERHRVPPRILPRRVMVLQPQPVDGVVDNISAVVEDGNGLTATTQMVHSENGTSVTVKIVKTAAGNRAKRSWIWQVMHEFKPSINGENVICSACKHLMSWVSTSGTTGTLIFTFVVYII